MNRRSPSRLLVVGVLLLAVAACAERRGTDGAGREDRPPESLSEWGMVTVDGGVLVLADGVLPYDLATPLFTDYAHKLRTVWMPPGSSAKYHPSEELELPVGTVITKTFYYPRAESSDAAVPAVLRTDDHSGDFAGEGLDLSRVRLMETRILVHREDGWQALPYVWNQEQTDARLRIAGDLQTLELVSENGDRRSFPYIVPSRNECASCHAPDHTSGALKPIGPKARHLNKVYAHYADGPAEQLERWQRVGYLDGAPSPDAAPRNALWQSGATDDLDHRARSYLDVNCGHCHNPAGPADTSGLFLGIEESSLRRLGVCKPPVAAGRGSGNRLFSIVPGHPEESILIFRMESTDPGEMMPELGRATVHEEGVELLRAWVAAGAGAEIDACT